MKLYPATDKVIPPQFTSLRYILGTKIAMKKGSRALCPYIVSSLTYTEVTAAGQMDVSIDIVNDPQRGVLTHHFVHYSAQKPGVKAKDYETTRPFPDVRTAFGRLLLIKRSLGKRGIQAEISHFYTHNPA